MHIPLPSPHDNGFSFEQGLQNADFGPKHQV
jgi:hypothetical protein